MVRSSLIIIAFFLISINLNAKSINSMIKSQAQITPNISIYVKNITKDKVIVAHRHDYAMTPASNQKILTTITALELLGPNYQFKTYIYTTGKIDESGTLNGHVYVDTKGDPSLTTAKIKKAVLYFKKTGLKKINGDLVINNDYYEEPFFNKTWKSSWKGLSWAPYISSIAVNENLYQSGDNLYLTDNPLYLLGVTLKRQFKNNGIGINGSISLRRIPILKKLNPLKSIFIINSNNLSNLIHIVNKKSNNLYAEHIFKKLSANYLRKSGSWRDSQKVMRFFLNKKVKIPNSNFNLEDGSGLSKYNKITTSSIALLLERATSKDYFDYFYDSLPIAGVDGTLLKRFKSKPLFKNLRAKTGYIKGVSSLSGYFIGKNNDLYCFSIIVNDHNYSIRNFIEKVLTKIYYL